MKRDATGALGPLNLRQRLGSFNPILWPAEMSRLFLAASALAQQDFVDLSNKPQGQRETLMWSCQTMIHRRNVTRNFPDVIERNSRSLIVFELASTSLQHFPFHANPIASAFISKPEKDNAGMGQAGTVDKLAKVFVICNHDAIFSDRDIQYGGDHRGWGISHGWKGRHVQGDAIPPPPIGPCFRLQQTSTDRRCFEKWKNFLVATYNRGIGQRGFDVFWLESGIFF